MPVDLGVIGDGPNFLLDSRFFPSKIGGKPAWLDLENLPPADQIVCPMCNVPRHFLCQLYCPINNEERAFHRTVFVFICLSKTCFAPNSSQNFVVFRCQLPRDNKYYPNTPPEEDENWRPDINCESFGIRLCIICGIEGKLICYKCNKGFCSEFHRNWCTCSSKNLSGENVSQNVSCIAEFPLKIEPEEEEDCSDDSSISGCSVSSLENDSEFEEKRRISEYEAFLACKKVGSLQNDPTVEAFVNDFVFNEDHYINRFKKRTDILPEQVIRYNKDEEPLWISCKNIPDEADIPPCDYCGSKRHHEFQVLPQMLNYLNLDTHEDHVPGILDWGTLMVYTCADSCNGGPSYKTEYLWKQDFVS